MPAEATSYERVNVIIPRQLKRELVKYAKQNESSLTRIMRMALREYMAKDKGKTNVRK